MRSEATVDAFADLLCLIIDEKPPTQPALGDCLTCGHALHWKLPVVGEWASPRCCPSCQRWYYSQCEDSAKLAIQYPQATPPRYDELAAIDRRSEPRYKISKPAVIVPLNADASAAGPAAKALPADLSWGGIELRTVQAINAPYLLVDFTISGCRGIQQLAEVRWKRCENGVHHTGCQFLNRTGEPLPLRPYVEDDQID